MEEVWKDIPGYEDMYQVSNFGRLKSVRLARIMSNRPSKNGYVVAKLWNGEIVHAYNLHSLIATIFIGPRPLGMDCCHGDGNRTNNRVDNLRWDTRKANVADSRTHGTYRHGGTHQNAKLKESEVLQIRERLSSGESGSSLAREYKISPAVISGIKTRRWWTHV